MKSFLAKGTPALLIALAAGCLVGCGGNKSVAAKVNNDNITLDQFNDRVRSIDAYEMQNSAQGRGPVRAGQLAMMRLVNEKLIEQAGAEKGIKPTDAEVAAFADFVKRHYANLPPNDQRAMLVAQQDTQVPFDPLRTDADWRRDAKIAMIERAISMRGVKLTDQDLQRVYDQANVPLSPISLREQAKYHLRFIEVGSEAKANQVIDTLNKGLPFDAVAMKMSEDIATRQRGGDPGVLWENMVPPVLRDAVKNLKPGQYTPKPVRVDPLVTAQGQKAEPKYAIVQLVEFMPGRMPTLAEVRPIVEWRALETKDPGFMQRVSGDLQAFKAKSKIHPEIAEYKDMFATPPATPTAGGSLPTASGAAPGQQ